MKNIKRFAGILLALTMICVMVLPAFAADKLDLQGSITITDNETVKASEKNFSAYQILELEVFGNAETGKIETYQYRVPSNAALQDFYAEYFGLDKADPNFSVKVVAAIDQCFKDGEIYAFEEACLEACADHVAPYNGKVVEGGFKFSPLPLGYYLIEDTTNPAEASHKPVSALALQTSKPDVTMEVKAEKPSIDKKIDDDNDLNTTEDRVDANEAAIGDTITYVITSKVPEMFGYDKYFFIISDTLSKGLTYTEDTMAITVGDKTLVKDVDYTLTVTKNEDGTTDLKIVFINFVQYVAEADIQVSYEAVLNQDCEVNTTPNPNKVYLEYSNNPKVDYAGENEPTDEEKEKDPLGKTPIEKVETYTTSLEIVKVDPNGTRLQGAEFTLTGNTMNTVRIETETFELDPNGEYWKLTDGSYTTTDPESIIDGVVVSKEKYESLTDKYTKTTTTTFETREGEALTVTGVVGEDGVLRFEGIPSGEYVIKEIKAPEGYNKMKETIAVTITAEYVETAGEGSIVYTYAGDGVVDNNGVARVTVINQIGSELPDTGGIGTTMFYVIGGVLVLAAIVLLIARKRMSAEA